jgi:ABC-type transport system substrate-binding protein
MPLSPHQRPPTTSSRFSASSDTGHRCARQAPAVTGACSATPATGCRPVSFSWYQDYPAPPDFIDPLFSCGSFLPDNQNNLNESEFCDPRIDAQAQRALTSQQGDPTAATTRWAAIDRELTDQAPWVPLYNPRDLTLLSTRVGNYQYHPYWDLLIDQLWVR